MEAKPMPILKKGRTLLLGLILLSLLSLPSISLAADDNGLASEAAQLAQVRKMYALVNAYRVANHRPKLRADIKLTRGAKAYSQKMVQLDFYSHTEPDGGTFERRFLRSGYVPRGWIWGGGENLAWTGSSDRPAERIFEMWKHSPNHRANMLLKDWKHMGAGLAPGNPYHGDLGSTWTIWFGEKLRWP